MQLSQQDVENWVQEKTNGHFHYTKVIDGLVDRSQYPTLRTIMHRMHNKGLAFPVDGKDGWWRKADLDIEEVCWWEGDVDQQQDSIYLPLGLNKYAFIPRPALVVVAGVYNQGKALVENTPILTAKGWKALSHLLSDDVVFGDDGKPTNVRGIFHQGLRHCYGFTFNDGSYIESDLEHVWKVMPYYNRNCSRTGRGNPNKRYKTWELRTTKDIVNMLGEGDVPSAKRFSVPTTQPIELPSQHIPLDPYILGVLLGNGSFKSTEVVVTTDDKEIIEAFTDVGLPVKHKGEWDYRVDGILHIIRGLGLTGHRSHLRHSMYIEHEKFIPRVYLHNDTQTRLAVLQGLMDTGGSGGVKKGDSLEFSSYSEQLSVGVQYLVRSLGGRATLHPTLRTVRKDTAAFSYQGVKRQGLPRYRVKIKMSNHFYKNRFFGNYTLFRLARKLKLRRVLRIGSCDRIIRKIEYVGEKNTICIKVDNKSGLFVAKDFIVTHNTAFCMNTIRLNVDKWKGNMALFVSEGMEQLKWKFQQLIPMLETPPPFKVYRRFDNFADVILPDGLNVIDYLRTDMEKSYAVSNKLVEINKKLKTGIAVVAMQKPPGRKVAFGGTSTAWEPALYVSLDKGSDGGQVLEFEKIKAQKLIVGDPYLTKIHFEIKQGVRFVEGSTEVG